MPKRKQHPHLYELAKRGAEARLQDLVHELKLLVELFPHLRDSFDRDELPISFLVRSGAHRAAKSLRAPRRRGWTPTQRKAAAARMKAYWARRKRESR